MRLDTKGIGVLVPTNSTAVMVTLALKLNRSMTDGVEINGELNFRNLNKNIYRGHCRLTEFDENILYDDLNTDLIASPNFCQKKKKGKTSIS